MERGTIYLTFEYVEPTRDAESIEIRIHFNYSPGCEAQTYGPAERCYPAESAEWEFDHAERETVPGKWQRLLDGEWLEGWCRAALENAEECDLVAGLPNREEP